MEERRSPGTDPTGRSLRSDRRGDAVLRSRRKAALEVFNNPVTEYETVWYELDVTEKDRPRSVRRIARKRVV